MIRWLVTIVFALAITGPLAACGKKGKLEPPKDEPITYPRQYPSE